MTERNYLSVGYTLPEHVTDTPESVEEFVHRIGGTYRVSPYENPPYRDNEERLRALGFVSVYIELPLRGGQHTAFGQSSVAAALQRGLRIQGLHANALRSWIVGEASGEPSDAYRRALVGAWHALIEFARWQSAHDAIEAVLRPLP